MMGMTMTGTGSLRLRHRRTGETRLSGTRITGILRLRRGHRSSVSFENGILPRSIMRKFESGEFIENET